MSFPGIIRRLFANGGASTTLRGDIIPYGTAASTVCQGNDARVVNAVPKSRKVNAGTGLSGGGDLSADRAFAVNFGTAAGTVCQGNDGRLSNARPPQAHKATHKTGGADALTPADIGAAAASVSISAGNGLTGGGNLTANRTLAVNFGTAAGTVCQGNDGRLSNARPPQAHKATHKTGGADALTPADIGAAAASVSISAGNGLTGGGNLTANRSLAVKFGTTVGTACQGNDARLTGAVNSINALNGSVNVLNIWRKQWIGVPRWWRSTTLPPHHIWADGTLVLFADWPEFKAVYDAGGFNGMLLEANATAAQISANLGKWKKHPNNLGLYAPQLGGQFFRGWTQGQAADAGREAGSWQQHEIYSHTHIPYSLTNRPYSPNIGSGYAGGSGATLVNASTTSAYGGAETRPVNIAQPVCIYLGTPR